MGHCVKNDIDTHRIGSLLGEFAEVPLFLAFPFPAITKVGIVAGDTHNTTAIVENGFVVDFFRAGALPSDAGATPARGVVNAGHLRFLFEIKDHVENRVFDRKLDGFGLGEDSFDFVVEIIILSVPPEIVHHEKSPIEQVVTEGHHFIFHEDQSSRFYYVQKRVVI